MSILISAHELTHAFAARPLFRGLTFSIESGEKIGLIGPNGAGKSTLLRILAGQLSADSGTLSKSRGLSVGYLEQVPSFEKGATVESTLLGAAPTQAEDWERHSRAQELMSKLELGDGPVDRLSGGWRKRVALARELMREPDLLLLDEPTNHLDVESILWLEEFIQSGAFACLTITHDRLFLQRISRRILELDPRNAGGILSVAGSYADYLETKEQLIQAQERREIILKNTLRRETEWLRRGAKARTTKQQARIQRAESLSEDVQELEVRNRSRNARIEFQGAEKNPKRLLEGKGLRKSYGDRLLFEGVNVLLTPGSRLGILGSNGCGKSTLIRVLLGEEAADQGEVKRSEHLRVAYFEQNRESLDPALSVSKTLCPVGEYVDFRGGRVHIRSYLDRFLFTQGQMDMAVEKLSGGEQSRLLIARLMLSQANLLVLDEPTNDLDMATLSVLEDCLLDFSGAILLVTHDRYFLDQVSTEILAFPPGKSSIKLVSFASLDQWEDWHSRELARETLMPLPETTVAKAASPPITAPAKKRKLSFKDQRELDGMERAILDAEGEVERLLKESESSENAKSAFKMREISEKLSAAQARVEALYQRWTELTTE